MRRAIDPLPLGLTGLALLLVGALLPPHSPAWYAAAAAFGLLSPFVLTLLAALPFILFELARRTARALHSHIVG
jgi:hypothetical protein